MRGLRFDRRRSGRVGRWPGLILAVVVGLVWVPAVFAQSEPTQDEINAVARKLFCPVCENTPLDVCPTQACQNWRDEIRVALVEGKTQQEILDDFAHKYGDSVLAQPPGRQWAAWGLPIAFVVVAFGALVYWLRSWTRPAPVMVEAGPVHEGAEQPEEDPYLEQVAKELAEWDR
jgi:cytochrome c-type biogenesis protein CcmH